ncbi:MAG: CRISPR-associated endonuclease Cas2 [Nitrososphaera sp.]
MVVYDVAVERIDRVRGVLKQYLNWVQNSAFEGELTEGQLQELSTRLRDAIEKEKDSILMYRFSNPKWVSKNIIGIEKSEISPVV